MRVAIYSLTRDRLVYSRACFQALRERAGYPFWHHVLDNGSQDGTQEWLRSEYRPAWFKPECENLGIARAANIVLAGLKEKAPDLVIKCDNDCMAVSEGIVARLVQVFEQTGSNWVLSPRVVGIDHQPKRQPEIRLAGHPVGPTSIIGGLFHCVPAEIYFSYRYDETLPLARGNDGHFCAWLQRQGVRVGYVEDLVVEHYETTGGQARRFPDYHARKRQEEGRA